MPENHENQRRQRRQRRLKSPQHDLGIVGCRMTLGLQWQNRDIDHEVVRNIFESAPKIPQ